MNIVLLGDAGSHQLFKAHSAAALQGTPTLYVLRYSTLVADDAFWADRSWVIFEGREERFEVLHTAPEAKALDSLGLTFLLKRALRDITYDSNMVVAWDHGNSFSIFKMPPPAPPSGIMSESPFLQIEAALNNPINNSWQLFVPKTSPVSPLPPLGVAHTIPVLNEADVPMASTSEEGPIFFDLAPQKPLALTMDELGDALRDLEKKVDILVLANCFMCSADTLYGLRDAAKILVAAETAIPFNLFDFAQVVKAGGSAQVTAREVSKRLIAQVKTSNERWYVDGVDRGLIRERIAIFALDMAQCTPQFWAALEQFCQVFTQHMESEGTAAEALVKRLTSLNPVTELIGSAGIKLYLCDASELFERAVYLFTDNLLLKAAYTDFVQACKWFIRNQSQYFIGAKAGESSYGCSGITVFLPRSRQTFDCPYIRHYYNGAQQNPYRSGFAKQHGWDEFLHAFFLNLAQ